MIPELTADNFAQFFAEVYGYPPFPWQDRLLRHLAKEGEWPAVLNLPTGSGKTAALDVAIFHLALEAGRGHNRRAPVRIVFVVDRRLVVNDAYARAQKLAAALASAKPATVLNSVAKRLRQIAGDVAAPLIARQLRGGIPLETDWARSPSQPTILCSTVDQAGSRLLFRGYGVSHSMKPVHAGLLGADALLLLDEAHLSEPFRQTLAWVRTYHGNQWCENQSGAPWSFTTLTATPGETNEEPFGLEEDDRENPLLQRRFNASKLASLVDVSKAGSRQKEQAGNEEGGDKEEAGKVQELARSQRVTEEAKRIFGELRKDIEKPAIAVVVNRVARARAVFEKLRSDKIFAEVELILMIGAARPVDREELAKKLEPIRTGNEPRCKDKALVIVSTQCIEAGVDIDLDGLITEAAPLDALRQRFGRLNRDGRPVICHAAIVGSKSERNDPIYGDAIRTTWEYLQQNANKPAERGSCAAIDFGLSAFDVWSNAEEDKVSTLLSPKSDGPVLMPAHLDLLSQTSPVPAVDPDVSLYLHGPERAADAVTVIWRSDITPGSNENRLRRLFRLMRPRALEAIELPVWAVKAWLRKEADWGALADIPSEAPAEALSGKNSLRQVFRWAGDDENSKWIDATNVRPGDMIIIPAQYGGVDKFGWNPAISDFVADVADRAAAGYAKRYLAVRVAPKWFTNEATRARLVESIETIGTTSNRWKDLRDALRDMISAEIAALEAKLNLTQEEDDRGKIDRMLELLREIKDGLSKLNHAKGKTSSQRSSVRIETEPYEDEKGVPQGVIFVAPFGVELGDQQGPDAPDADDSPNTTEDDLLGSLWNAPSGQLLQEHCRQVEERGKQFAECAGLPPDRIADLTVAAYLHDAGKADPRFQRWLAYGDPLGPDPNDGAQILAKSNRPAAAAVCPEGLRFAGQVAP